MNNLIQTEHEKLLAMWENADFTNNFLFCKILTQNPDVCKELIEILLQIEIDHIEIVQDEKTTNVDMLAHGIRMDVYVKDSNRIFDLEMQNIDTKDLPKRSRYYQGVIDIDTLYAGDDYKKLTETYIIFICLRDIFGKNEPVYRFQYKSDTTPQILLGDETTKIFFNATAYDKIEQENLRDFLSFLINRKANSEFTEKLTKLVQEAKHNVKWRQRYMILEHELMFRYNRGFAEGLNEGKSTGFAEGKSAGFAEGKSTGFAEGKSTGFAEGKSETLRENLIKLLNSRTLTVEQIAKIFEVDVEFVKGLEEELCNN